MTVRALALLLGAGPAAVGLVWHGAPRGTGEVAWVVDDGTNLRAGPSLDSPVLSRLSLGEEVTILGIAAPIETIDGLSERWYNVRSYSGDGCVFGGTLTSARWEADLDDDNELERATVSLTGDGGVMVRISELAVPPPGRVAGARIDAGDSAAGMAAVKKGPELSITDGSQTWTCRYTSRGPGYVGKVDCR